MDPAIARKTWRTVEPYHGAIYFVPEAGEEYARVGIDDWMSGYFASRSAAMGAVGADVARFLRPPTTTSPTTPPLISGPKETITLLSPW